MRLLQIFLSDGISKVGLGTHDPRTFKKDSGYLISFHYRKQQLSCHIHSILGLIHYVKHKATIIFQTETPVGQSLVFRLFTFKLAKAKTYFLQYICITTFCTPLHLSPHLKVSAQLRIVTQSHFQQKCVFMKLTFFISRTKHNYTKSSITSEMH